MITAFNILDVSTDASDDDIKKAYLKKVKIYSPEQAPDEFQKIRSAFELINSEDKRIKYQLFNNDIPNIGAFLEASMSSDKLQTNVALLTQILLESLHK
jgi:curved DNA-binding protein CbpA